MLEGVAYLVEGITLSPMPSSSVGRRWRLLRHSLPGRGSVVGSGLERSGGESLQSVYGPMTTTPWGSVYLLEGVILLLFSFLSSFRVKT